MVQAGRYACFQCRWPLSRGDRFCGKCGRSVRAARIEPSPLNRFVPASDDRKQALVAELNLVNLGDVPISIEPVDSDGTSSIRLAESARAGGIIVAPQSQVRIPIEVSVKDLALPSSMTLRLQDAGHDRIESALNVSEAPNWSVARVVPPTIEDSNPVDLRIVLEQQGACWAPLRRVSSDHPILRILSIPTEPIGRGESAQDTARLTLSGQHNGGRLVLPIKIETAG